MKGHTAAGICDEYSRTVERSMKKFPMDNGVIDSIRQMLVIF